MSTLPEYLVNPDPQLYYSENFVTLDFETTNIEKGTALNEDNRIVLAVWHDGQAMYHKTGGEYEQQELVEACNNADFLVAHGAKFELQWLERCGYDIGSRPVWCTLVGEWVIAGNRKRRLSLDAALARIGLPSKTALVTRLIKGGVCPSTIHPSLLLRYCAWDVEGCRQLFFTQRDQDMAGTRLVPVQYTRCLAIPVLADIETNGLHLDAARVEEEYEKYSRKYQEVMAELEKIAAGVNPKSPPQLAHFLYGELGFKEKTDKSGEPIRNKPTKQFPDGLPKTDEATLLSLGAVTPKQRLFLDLKKKQAKLSAAIDKNLAMFLGACREKDSMIYAELLHGRTVTHRLASAGRSTYYDMFEGNKGCQFQNLPRKFKRLFSPRRDGWLFFEGDYGSLEFGVAGDVGEDDTIRDEIRHNYDVHRYTASVINNIPEDEVVPAQRTEAKKDTFKPLYGGQSGTRGQRAYYKAFGEKYHQLKHTQDGWCIEAEATKMLQTKWGMIFYFPHARFDAKGWLNCKTNVYNTPIQSFATADIVPVGLVYLWHRTRDMEAFLVNTVHDSIEAELPAHERELFQDTVVQSLTEDVYRYLDVVYNVQFSVPLSVGMTIGSHWGEPLDGEEEISIQVETPYVCSYEAA